MPPRFLWGNLHFDCSKYLAKVLPPTNCWLA